MIQIKKRASRHDSVNKENEDNGKIQHTKGKGLQYGNHNI